MTRNMFGIALIASALASSPAAAQPDDTVSATVSISDLDLASPAGQTMAQKRIRHAARKICQTGDQWGLLAVKLETERCEKQAIASAQPQVDRAVAFAFARKRGADQLALAARK